MNEIVCVNEYRCCGGTVGYYTHDSRETRTSMRFSLFIPPESTRTGACLVFLSGLTCTEENFTTKASAYKKAAELGLHILAPDTSPRGEGVPDDKGYDLGQGAGFYLDATQEPWSLHFRMESYLVKELIPACLIQFKLDPTGLGVTGHSMGGHGALTLHLKHPDLFKTCSAFSPIVAPCQVPWGQKAFSAYLGEDQRIWQQHDATELVQRQPTKAPILIDQGLADGFLHEQLKPDLFKVACNKAGQAFTLRQHEGYDHSYFFIQTFIDDHLYWHMNGSLKS